MSAILEKLQIFFKSLFKIIGGVIVSAFTWIVLFAVAGVVLIALGVYELYGIGLSFIVLGIFLLLFMALIARGAAND